MNRRETGPRWAAAALVAVVAHLTLPALGSTAGAVPAHDEAVIESPQSSVAAGGTLTVSGKDFTAGERYALRLVGALREYDLRQVEPEEGGTFTLELGIPREAATGAYQVVAVAPDGDEVARMDLQVLPAGPAADGPAVGGSGAEGAATGDHGGSAARADDIRMDRDRSGVEWAAIGLIVGVAGGLGVGLLRRNGRS